MSSVSAVIVGNAIVGTIVLSIAARLYRKWVELRRAEYIRTFRWPRGVLERLEKHYPAFERKDSALVSRGLRTRRQDKSRSAQCNG